MFNMRTILLGLMAGLISTAALAGDIAGPSAITKALTAGYPTKCGVYYGIGTGGNAGAVTGGPVGAQVIEGDLDGIVGYTCPFATNAFWFVEGQGGFSNLNGSSSGLSLSGPGLFIERFGAGSPINNLLGAILPASLTSALALPSLPALPNGVTAGPFNAYAFVGMVQQDFGAQVGNFTGHDWLNSPLIGLGALSRLNDNVVVDVWAGYQMNATNSLCLGSGDCIKPSNMVRTGVSFKY